MAKDKGGVFRFTAGPWNIHEGADPFGPPVREKFSFAEKLGILKKLGFDGVQFHDDDVVADDVPHGQAMKTAKEVKKMLGDYGLAPEFVAPRLWEDPRTLDGGWTSNCAKCRAYAMDRTKRTIDIANALGTRKIVLWPAREGTYVREAKDPVLAYERTLDYLNGMLKYDRKILVLGEMKPNEPMDTTFLPTSGHFLAIGYRTADPKRVGVLIESAHSMLAGLDPSEEFANALWHGKLWGVHLNDQDGLKFDEDKSFGSVNLRRALNMVWVLDRAGYGRKGEYVGMDVKAMRTQKKEVSCRHLENSVKVFKELLRVARSLDDGKIEGFRQARDYEALDLYVTQKLMGL